MLHICWISKTNSRCKKNGGTTQLLPGSFRSCTSSAKIWQMEGRKVPIVYITDRAWNLRACHADMICCACRMAPAQLDLVSLWSLPCLIFHVPLPFGQNIFAGRSYMDKRQQRKVVLLPGPPRHKQEQLDDGWPESVEEQGLLLLVWRHNITNNILKMCYRQSRRGVSRQNSRSARQ